MSGTHMAKLSLSKINYLYLLSFLSLISESRTLSLSLSLSLSLFLSLSHLHRSNSTKAPPRERSMKKQVRDGVGCGFRWWDWWDKGCVLCSGWVLCVGFLGVGINEFLWVVMVVGGGRRLSGRGSWQCDTTWCVREGRRTRSSGGWGKEEENCDLWVLL